MKTLLQINSGMKGEHSYSTQLANQVAERLKSKDVSIRHIKHDLSKEPIQPLTCEIFEAFSCQEQDLSREQKKHLASSDHYIRELKEADILVLGIPMYNFMIPSSLKCWIDQITRAGKTFRFTDKGPVGLLENRPCYACIARGGSSSDGATDLMKGYLKMILNFLGIRDIEFIIIEGLALAKEDPIKDIKAAIDVFETNLLDGI